MSERHKRWRLVLGEEANPLEPSLDEAERGMDGVLAALYGQAPALAGASPAGRGKSAPRVSRWLGDIRRYFPRSVVRVLQRDALERLGLAQMLLEPEMLEAVTPDVHLVATLLQLKGVVPAKTKATARAVVANVVEQVMRQLSEPMREAVTGSLHRGTVNRRPRHREIDWPRTIRANLRTYQPEHKSFILERRIGFGRKRSALEDVVLCVDQSGSMAQSVVYASIFAAVLASLPALRTHLVVFDTAVVDLSEALQDDPVDVLFGLELGGGTDIDRAVGYCQSLVTRPEQTVFVLITDLYEGGDRARLLQRVAALVASGVRMVALLSLDDEGAPWFDHALASELAALGVPCFACTPDRFPSLMAAALGRRDLEQWAAGEGLVTARARGH